MTTFSQADLEQQLAVANFAAAHGWIVALIAATGFLLESVRRSMLINRVTAALFACALVGFHLGLDYTMRLTFIYNQWLLVIFMINAPYWIVTGAGKSLGLVAPAPLHPHDLIAAVDVEHLAGDRGRAVAGEENSGRPISAGSQLRFSGACSW